MSTTTTAHNPFALVCIEKEMSKVTVGITRVQNYWGDSGKIIWTGVMKNGPWGKGTYAAVQYDEPNPLNEKLTDGTFEGERICEGPAHSCGFNPLRHLYFEVNHLVISHFRSKFGAAVDRFHDFELVKVAIARHFSPALMDKTMEDHLKWYEESHPDPAKEWFHPKLSQYFPSGFPEAWDREGNLLHIARPGLGGEISPAQVVKEVGVEPLVRMSTIQHEEMKALLREKGFKHHKRFSSMYDLKDLGSVDGKTMDFAKGLAEVNKNHQLEIVGKIFMVNAPFFFRAVFKTISLFMDERTRDKVIVLGSDYEEELAKYVDPKFWPAFAGGTNEEWYARGGRVGQAPPEENPPVTHGVVGEPYDLEHNLFPEARKARDKHRKEEGKAAEKAAKKEKK